MLISELKFKDASPFVSATGRLIKSSSRKLNLVAKSIRGKKASAAVALLDFCQKAVAYDVSKILKSAIANAENNYALDVENLYIKEAFVGKAMMLKRLMPMAKGRGARIKKRFSRITVVLGEVEI